MSKRDFLQSIQQAPLVFDGAMGTMIYDSGVFINTCYDELVLTRAKLIRDIHRRYVEAGADVITTNSFGANRIKLGQFGLAASVEQINRTAAELARSEAGEDVFVAGSVGPCTNNQQVLLDESIDEVREAFAEQMAALAAGGVDYIALETFSDGRELEAAAAAARATNLPVAASIAVTDHTKTAVGAEIEALAAALNDNPDVDVIGLNCGAGPAGVYDILSTVLALTGKPVVVQPNAGFPRDVGGRMLYLASPEYLTEYAKKFIEMGVRGVGGCCGTTPEHIRILAKAVKTLSGVKRHVEIIARSPQTETTVKTIPMAEKSRLAGKLARHETVTSVELLPPRSCDMATLIAKARKCAIAGVDAINIPDGPRASARISPMIASIAIEAKAGIESVLHYCCRDRNLIGMQSDLMGGYAAGLRNFLIITGDPPKLGDYPDATGVFDVDAIGLTRLASNLNAGFDVAGAAIDPPTGTLIGVGANPCAVDLPREIERYYRKIDAGAEFAITQPVFDTDALLRFIDEVDTYSRRIPIIAGVWPLLSFKNAEFMNNEVPGVEVPDEMLERMSKCVTKEEGRHVGIEIAQEVIARIADRVAGFQVSAPLGNVEIALEVLSTVIGQPRQATAT